MLTISVAGDFSIASVRVTRKPYKCPTIRARRFLCSGPKDHDVLRFQVPMYDPGCVSCRQAICDLSSVFDRIVKRQEATVQKVSQRLTLNKLHDYIVGSHVVDDNYVRRIERRRPRFFLEPKQAAPGVWYSASSWIGIDGLRRGARLVHLGLGCSRAVEDAGR